MSFTKESAVQRAKKDLAKRLNVAETPFRLLASAYGASRIRITQIAAINAKMLHTKIACRRIFLLAVCET